MSEPHTHFPSSAGLIWRLITKDVHLHHRVSVGSIGLGAVAILLLAGPGGAGLFMGGVLMVTVLIALGAGLVFLTVIEERQQRTLPFLLTLPISRKHYALSKIATNGLLFGIPWSLLVLASLALILHSADLPDGLVAPMVIAAGEIALSTSLILLVAMVSQSLVWTIAMTILGNLLFNGFVFLLFNTPVFAATAESPEISWPPEALLLVAAEIAGIVLLCGLAYAVSSRRKDIL